LAIPDIEKAWRNRWTMVSENSVLSCSAAREAKRNKVNIRSVEHVFAGTFGTSDKYHMNMMDEIVSATNVCDEVSTFE
jgi:hypothetical protein